MLQVGVNPDGTPEEMPDMDEVQRLFAAFLVDVVAFVVDLSLSCRV